MLTRYRPGCDLVAQKRGEKMAEESKNKGHENLIPLNKRTPEEAREIAIKGGKARAEQRRLSRDMRESVKVMLNMTIAKDKQREVLGDMSELLDGYTVSMADLINMKLLQEATEGNSRAWELLRDTAGFKPVEQIQSDVNIMTESDKALLDKLAKRNGIETE